LFGIQIGKVIGRVLVPWAICAAERSAIFWRSLINSRVFINQLNGFLPA
jgi:hypothetical protein